METRSGETPSEGSLPSQWTATTCAIATTVAYLLLARFSLLFMAQPEQIAAFWLPNGLLVAVLLERSRHEWGWLLAGGCGANLLVNLWTGDSLGLSFGFAFANGLEAWLVAWLLVNYIGTPITFCRLREVFGLVVIAGVPACACGGLLGAATVTLGVDGTSYWSVWRVWMVADLLGVLLMTPLVIAWNSSGAMAMRLLSPARWAEAVVLFVLLLGLTAFISQQTPGSIPSLFIRPYLVTPILLWAAMRFRDWGAATAILAVALVAVWYTAHGDGLVARPEGFVTVQMLAMQMFLLVLVLATLVMVAVLEERARLREQLELVIRGTDAGVWDWNMLTNEVYLSPRWKSMLGFADHELQNSFESWESRIHSEDHGRSLATFRDYMAGRIDQYELAHRLRHRDGTYRWVLSRGMALRDASGRPVRLAGSHLDITAIKRVEEALRESEQHFSAAFDDSPIGMDLVDLRGHLVRVNAAYCRMMGYTSEQLIGKHLRDITHPGDVLADQVSMKEFLSGQRTTYQTEKRYVRSDGELVWALLNVTVVMDSEGQPLHFFGQVQDITQLKRDEAELRRQADELERSNQELDDFAYIASHDLKAPLRGIENLAKWITEDSEASLSEPSRELLRKLRQRVTRMDRLLDDLLQFSRTGQMIGDLSPVDSAQLVREVVNLLAPDPGFLVVLSDNLPVFITHKTPLELVFRNLIDNALKHHHGRTGRIEVSAKWIGRFVEFAVSDDGPGIPAEYHDRIFRMFQTLKPRDELEGSGIGLAVVKKVIERHGGQIRVESVIGQGTTFRFTWPKQNSPPGKNHGELTAVDSARGR